MSADRKRAADAAADDPRMQSQRAHERPPADASERLSLASAAFSVLLAGALLAVHAMHGSELALAQAADSLSDVLGGVLLVWAARASAAAADADHPHGHAPAQPIAALVVAMLIGGVAVEVARGAVETLAFGRTSAIDGVAATVFSIKITFRAVIASRAHSATRRPSPTLAALRADAIADVLVGFVSLAGYGLSRAGLPRVDAVLAVLVAIYVAVAGIRLARENIVLLMGSSAPASRIESMRALVESVPGVSAVDEIVATWHGAALHVFVDISVGGSLTVERGHEIAHTVEERLMREPDVARARVHVGPLATS